MFVLILPNLVKILGHFSNGRFGLVGKIKTSAEPSKFVNHFLKVSTQLFSVF
jgi:hypothetical protein